MSEPFHYLLWPSMPSAPRPSDPLLPSPAWPTPHRTTAHQTQCSGKEPTASLGKLPGSGPGFPAEWAEPGALIILESSSGVRSPPRSVVLASELAEVRMGLAWGVVSLRKKPEMGLTILLLVGRGKTPLRGNCFYRDGVPRPSAHRLWWAHRQLLGARAVFSRPLGLLCAQGRLAHSRASYDLWAWQRGILEPDTVG